MRELPSIESVIEDLEKTRSALWHVDAMATVLSHWEGGDSEAGLVIKNYIETMRSLLGPTYETIDTAIERLQA